MCCVRLCVCVRVCEFMCVWHRLPFFRRGLAAKIVATDHSDAPSGEDLSRLHAKYGTNGERTHAEEIACVVSEITHARRDTHTSIEV